jgi:hypothetical protein
MELMQIEAEALLIYSFAKYNTTNSISDDGRNYNDYCSADAQILIQWRGKFDQINPAPDAGNPCIVSSATYYDDHAELRVGSVTVRSWRDGVSAVTDDAGNRLSTFFQGSELRSEGNGTFIFQSKNGDTSRILFEGDKVYIFDEKTNIAIGEYSSENVSWGEVPGCNRHGARKTAQMGRFNRL